MKTDHIGICLKRQNLLFIDNFLTTCFEGGVSEWVCPLLDKADNRLQKKTLKLISNGEIPIRSFIFLGNCGEKNLITKDMLLDRKLQKTTINSLANPETELLFFNQSIDRSLTFGIFRPECKHSTKSDATRQAIKRPGKRWQQVNGDDNYHQIQIANQLSSKNMFSNKFFVGDVVFALV